jgi:hypothetical protein
VHRSPDVVLVRPELERPHDEKGIRRQPHAVHGDDTGVVALPVDKRNCAIDGNPPIAACLRWIATRLRRREALGRHDVIDVSHILVPGERPLHVELDTDQVADQALDVEVTQHRRPPLLSGETG